MKKTPTVAKDSSIKIVDEKKAFLIRAKEANEARRQELQESIELVDIMLEALEREIDNFD